MVIFGVRKLSKNDYEGRIVKIKPFLPHFQPKHDSSLNLLNVFLFLAQSLHPGDFEVANSKYDNKKGGAKPVALRFLKKLENIS